MILIKRKFLVVSLIILIIIFVGCGKVDNNSTDQNENHSALNEEKELDLTLPYSHKMKVTDNVLIDAKVIVPENIRTDGFYIANATEIQYDSNQIESIFWEANNTDEEIWTSQEEKSIYGENGDLLIVNPSYITYNNDWSQNIGYSFRTDRRTGDYNRNLFEKDIDFAFKSRNEVEIEINELFAQLGMKEASYEFISLDYQTLENESMVYDKFGGIEELDYEWSEMDNCYVINVRQTCNELPIIYKEFIATQSQINAICTAEILYSDKGISKFTANKIYQIEYKNEKVTLMDFEKVIGLFNEKINITLSENDRNIDTISLMALPIKQRDGDYEIIPVWAFMGDITFKKGEINQQYPFSIIFNAVTGEEIVS